MPVIHPTMMRAYGETENAGFTTATQLRDAGIPFALQSGFEATVPKTRVVLFEAGVAAAHGLGFDDALRSVTIEAAAILGIDDRVGSLEKGRTATSPSMTGTRSSTPRTARVSSSKARWSQTCGGDGQLLMWRSRCGNGISTPFSWSAL